MIRKLTGSLLMAVLLAACDPGTPTDPPPAGDCGNVALSGAFVPEVAGPGTKPAPAGGTLTDGTYVLNAWHIYPPSSVDPIQRKQVIRISGNQFQYVGQRNNDPVERMSGTWSASGTTLTFSITCPQTATATWQYTASGTELRQIEPNEVHVFTKQ